MADLDRPWRRAGLDVQRSRFEFPHATSASDEAKLHFRDEIDGKEVLRRRGLMEWGDGGWAAGRG